MDYEISLALRYADVFFPFYCTITRNPRLVELSPSGKRRVTIIKTQNVTRLDKGGKHSGGYKMFGGAGLAHVALASLFLEQSPNLNMVNHLDGFKDNNVLTNIEWTDRSGNTVHAYENGLIDKRKQSGKTPWNKGKTGLQVAWNKGLTKNQYPIKNRT